MLETGERPENFVVKKTHKRDERVARRKRKVNYQES